MNNKWLHLTTKAREEESFLHDQAPFPQRRQEAAGRERRLPASNLILTSLVGVWVRQLRQSPQPHHGLVQIKTGCQQESQHISVSFPTWVINRRARQPCDLSLAPAASSVTSNDLSCAWAAATSQQHNTDLFWGTEGAGNSRHSVPAAQKLGHLKRASSADQKAVSSEMRPSYFPH